jgi:hypothetical protein
VGWPSRSLLVATGSLIPTPQILSAHTASAAPTATSCTVLVTVDGLLVPPAYISADVPLATLAQKKAIAAVRTVRLAAAPIACNTKHGVAYTKRKCQRCETGVDNEHHLLFECSHVALVASIRSKHRALFDGVRDVRDGVDGCCLQTGTSSHSRKLHARHDALLEAGLEGQPNITLVTPAS